MEMERKHYPDEMVEAIRDTLDCNPVFHGNVVSVNQMIGIMMGSIAVFGIIYYFVTLLPDGEGRREEILFLAGESSRDMERSEYK